MFKKFTYLTRRLSFIEFTKDVFKNFEIDHCITLLEQYIYGINLQYSRIKRSLKIFHHKNHPSKTALEIYYYILTWDKVKKVFEKFKSFMNPILKDSRSDFKEDFRILKSRFENFFKEININARNEYEHPSLKLHRSGNFLLWNVTYCNIPGDIKAHVGGNKLVIIKKSTVEKLNSLWVDLIDLILKHFTNKISSKQLLIMKKHIENNINKLANQIQRYQQEGKDEEVGKLIGEFTRYELFLSTEGIQISPKAKDKIYTFLFKKNPIVSS